MEAGTTADVGPELVFGVVRPVGTPDEEFKDALRAALTSYRYAVHDVKLSDLLRNEALRRGEDVPTRHEEDRVAALMDEGDRLCNESKTGSAVALLGVAAMRGIRRLGNAARGIEDDAAAASVPLPRTAYLLDSLKRPAEITHLRRLYGDHFVVVSLQASIERRTTELNAKIKLRRASSQDVGSIVSRLIERDLRERDELGQNTLLAFPMADVFIDLERDVPQQVTSVVDLLFDSPRARQPTVAEFSMSVAEIASTRSSELGLKVGAALVTAAGDVVGLGHNAHPEAGAAPTFDASLIDITELLVDTLASLPPDVLADRARAALGADPDEFANELLNGPLRQSRLRGLIEFQRPVHAEMNALLAALRGRAAIAGTTMFVTAFPCHHCARHLVALGLTVTYLAPYPKSRAESMYGAAVGASFHPFTGIAPRRYAALFSVTVDRKDVTGARRPWGEAERASAIPKVDPFMEPHGVAVRELSALGAFTASRSAGRPPNLSHRQDNMAKVSTGAAGTPSSATRRTTSRRSSPTSPAQRTRPKGGTS
ncbi:MAG TPA: hypothetical protein VNA20_07435 [Frankiaceae bacterium]|nr:hypothetical protein [Frankiaceae bacterium]